MVANVEEVEVVKSNTVEKAVIKTMNMFDALEDTNEMEVVDVNSVETPNRITGEITIDSGAGRNVWPKSKKVASKTRVVKKKR